MKEKKKETEEIYVEKSEKPVQPGLKRSRCLQVIDKADRELSIKDIRTILEEDSIDEINIFGISNKLIKDITKYLDEHEISYYMHGRSRIVLHK